MKGLQKPLYINFVAQNTPPSPSTCSLARDTCDIATVISRLIANGYLHESIEAPCCKVFEEKWLIQANCETCR